jgi:hypothetical protein
MSVASPHEYKKHEQQTRGSSQEGEYNYQNAQRNPFVLAPHDCRYQDRHQLLNGKEVRVKGPRYSPWYIKTGEPRVVFTEKT